MNKSTAILPLLLLLLVTSCATYRPLPLTDETVAAGLKPPRIQDITIEAQRLEHPLLQPVKIDLRDGLSPDEAAVLAVLVHPGLRAVRDQRGIATAQLLQAGILPNPQISYSFDVPTGGTTAGKVNAFGFGLDWDLQALITRQPRVDAAQARLHAISLDIAWQEWQVAQAAKQHVLRLVSLTKQVALARTIAQELEENLTLVQQAVALGAKTARDLAAAETALQQARFTVLTLQQQQEQERLALNQALGLPPDRDVPLQTDMVPPEWHTLPAAAQLLEHLEARRLDLVALKMGYASQEAQLRAAIKAQFPRIRLGLAEARDTENVITTGFSVSLELPFFDRNQGRIALERATRQELFDAYIARLFDARAAVFRLRTEIDAVTAQVGALEAALPGLERLVQTYATAVQEGNADLLSYYDVRNTLATQRIDILQRLQRLNDLGIALEIVTGQYVSERHGPSTPVTGP
jgi:cobalt-zinc-cadmium efflux system outer membrane protein